METLKAARRPPVFGGLSLLAVPVGGGVGIIAAAGYGGYGAAIAGLMVAVCVTAVIGLACLILSRLNNERYAPLAWAGAVLSVIPGVMLLVVIVLRG
ncbi:hypothetical protein VDF98_12615 [Xanthomonas campestris pv. raphani]|uniref:hypothetical protein n=1 Tax=Xanthomonas campestris TaxID=339 RepID=UPI0005C6BDB0|nr:hypothetical protein [Xanthomonas campestris]MEB2182434.1 hypothetical protein [Xanthomonas campestris pv. campestris]MEA9654609.1 hypothetical protein [Xanthomonas campestris pv. raphani]MEA9656853.1 hypothetical protein [Xanthomonas campestris pv. raphani]MEA9676214.1 hypothetical protein [Xanthomonas campestris pv. raphani]MEA9709960.1 hypothetical protein [Xanthomonas campestris]